MVLLIAQKILEAYLATEVSVQGRGVLGSDVVLDSWSDGNNAVDMVVDAGKNVLPITVITECAIEKFIATGDPAVVTTEDIELGVNLSDGIDRETSSIVALDVVGGKAHVVFGTNAEIAMVVASEDMKIFAGHIVDGSVG